ncbi:hypothetical protein H4R34_003662 [Dimargaris verticillata]|uniref:ABC-2 type transporter domain-containing protein n=1 Tax=Dimargaris verticillata TaxID=2761393 RepID=A0A9W8B1V4_9FUNG|nr:hypothetical protein H4R34_003662 [Dimargaris verticillata]
MTIHQPSAKAFSLFDKVIMLSQGQMVYYGAVDQALGYFAGLGYQCGQHENPADFYLDLMSVDVSSKAAQERSHERVNRLIQHFHDSSAYCQASYGNQSATSDTLPSSTIQRAFNMLSYSFMDGDNSVRGLVTPGITGTSPCPGHRTMGDRDPVAWALPWYREFFVLLCRCWQAQIRDRMLVVAKGFQWLALMLIIGISFFQLKVDQASIQNRDGLLFFIPVGLSCVMIVLLTTTFSLERSVIARERRARSYRMSTFYLARFLTELPLTIGLTVINATGVYFLAGLQADTSKFIIFLGISILTVLVAISIGLATSATFANVDVALVMGAFSIVISLLYAGHLFNVDDVLIMLRWIKYVSFVRYSYQALAINEYTGLKFTCGEQQATLCVEKGEDILLRNSLDSLSLSTCMAVLAAIVLFFQIWAYNSLRWKNRPRSIWI